MKLFVVLLLLFILINIIKSNEFKLNSNSIINNIHHSGRLLRFEGLFNYIDNSTFESISLGSKDLKSPLHCKVIEYNQNEIKCLLDQYDNGCLTTLHSSKLIGYNDGFKSIENQQQQICNKPYIYKVNMVLEKNQQNEQEFIITILGDNLGDYPVLGIIFGTRDNNFNKITNQKVSTFENNRRTPLSIQDVSSISKEINNSTYYQFNTIQSHYAFLQVKVDNQIAQKFKQQYEEDQSLISFLVFSHNSNEININHIHIEPIHWNDISIKIINKPLFYFKCFSTVITGLSILIIIIVSSDKKKSKKD